MCIIAEIGSFIQKGIALGNEALMLGFLLRPYGISMIVTRVIAFLQGINEAIKSIYNFIKTVIKGDRQNYRLFLCEILRRGGESIDFS